MRRVKRGRETESLREDAYLYLSGKLYYGYWTQTNIENENVVVHTKVNSRVHELRLQSLSVSLLLYGAMWGRR